MERLIFVDSNIKILPESRLNIWRSTRKLGLEAVMLLFLASMEVLGTRKLMSHDQAFKRLDFIE
jgi:hypothetical protein